MSQLATAAICANLSLALALDEAACYGKARMNDIFKTLGAGAWPRLAVALALLALIPACRDQASKQLKFALVIGSRGHSSGKFNRPRGICYDPDNKLIFVVDWDGRVQKFTLAGKFRGSWIMPAVAKGKPEDLCRSKTGTLLVADTHYSRIVEFSPKGEVLRKFGSYGQGPGQFIYPVGICVDAAGNIYVSEYGDNNRVQKFTPEGKFISSFGGFGSAPGQFQRPSGMAIGPDQRLYVTDAVNHRIQVFELDGKLVRVIGRQGRSLGALNYPYDVDFKGGYMYVLEYGNQRVQKMTLEGKGLAGWGAPGHGQGQFASPWRFTVVENALYISDTDNCRVVKIKF